MFFRKIIYILFLIILITSLCRAQTGNHFTHQMWDGKQYLPNETLTLENTCYYSQPFLKNIFTFLRYPFEAREKGISGEVIIEMEISEHGELLNSLIVEDIGYRCGESALKALHKAFDSCNEPIKLLGIPVRTKMYIPIKFKLD